MFHDEVPEGNVDGRSKAGSEGNSGQDGRCSFAPQAANWIEFIIGSLGIATM